MRQSTLAVGFATAITTTQAHAVRPFVTDDARIIDPGQIEVEMWPEFGRYEGDLSPGFHGMMGVSFNEWFELIAGAGYNRNLSRRLNEIADPVIQPKLLLLRAEEDGRPGFALLLGTTLPTARWGGHSTLFGNFAIVCNTTRLFDDWLFVHVNYGVRMVTSGSGEVSARPYWGVGFDAAIGHIDWRFIGEAYAGDPFEVHAPLVAFQWGFRWLHSDAFNFDLTFGLQPDTAGGGGWRHPDLWAQTGIRVLFDAFNKNRRPGDPNGAIGAFSYPNSGKPRPTPEQRRSIRRGEAEGDEPERDEHTGHSSP